MAGIIANDFLLFSDKLIAATAQIHSSASKPSLILCHSTIAMKFLKYFFAEHNRSFAHTHCHTFSEWSEVLAEQILPGKHILNDNDIRFLLQNHSIHADPHLLSKIFLGTATPMPDPPSAEIIHFLEQQIQMLHWLTPHQALIEMLHRIPPQPMFSNCILMGYSSRERYPHEFLTLIKKTTDHVLFLALDRGDGELEIFEALEGNFGPGETVYRDRKNKSIEFSIVADSVDAARCCGVRLGNDFPTGEESVERKAKTTAIICPSELHAELVAQELNAHNLCHHNGFQTRGIDPKDNLILAWYQFQREGDFQHFLSFLDLIALGEQSNLGDYYAYLSQLFHLYPIDSIASLLPHINHPQISEILQRYPPLAEKATMGEYIQQTTSIIPEMNGQKQFFGDHFPVRKKAFLDYALAVYNNTKPPREEPFYAPIFIMDMFSATQFHFDRAIVMCPAPSSNDHASEFENLLPYLNADHVHLIAEKNNISNYFAQQYQNTHHCILNGETIRQLTQSFSEKNDGASEKYEFLKPIHRQRNDGNITFGPFEYTVGNREALTLSATAIERAFTAPEEIWYRHILKNYRPSLRFDRARFAGIFTHNFLRWPKGSRPSLEAYGNHINQQQKQLQQILEPFIPGPLLREAMDCQRAYVLAEKISRWEDFPF
ncbi:MAG: hypothetical protein LBN94_02135, partial [Puniceicoccales bacterium]|nr:hypothetical protein [Puniceicoccales bacterium]